MVVLRGSTAWHSLAEPIRINPHVRTDDMEDEAHVTEHDAEQRLHEGLVREEDRYE
jgi:hypothetical protein